MNASAKDLQPGNRSPRILIVTPEISYLPHQMGSMARHIRAKVGGLADVSASLVAALFELGADVHVSLPHYRRMFHVDIGKLINHELRIYKSALPQSRVHLAQDRVFYYRDQVYSNYHVESHQVALAFQREVINNIVPLVNPDLIHCNDWMTGLIPAMARRMGIPCLFTVHNIHTHELTLEDIENSGIDAAEFWPNLYFKQIPHSYEETRSSNQVDLLTSGIFASHFVNTVSTTFLNEICEGRHAFIPLHVRQELINKRNANCAFGIVNAPDSSYNPETDELIECTYSAQTHAKGKRTNKELLQDRLGLIKDPSAPVLFWPSRLDPRQKGPELFTHILYDVVSAYREKNLQVIVVANGPYQEAFRSVVRFHDMHEHVAICDFEEDLSHMGYAASDFIIMPSAFEPCGLPQMISCLYGSLPIVRDTGGIHDTVSHLDPEKASGNGFVFKTYDPPGLRWAIDRALEFYDEPAETRARTIARVMTESARTFSHNVTARNYFDLYERMLKRPLSRLSDDPYLKPYLKVLRRRFEHALTLEARLTQGRTALADFASGHEYFGLHRTGSGWIFREWAPNATAVYLVGTCSNWQESQEYSLSKVDEKHGIWELQLHGNSLAHGDLYRLSMHWPGGHGDRIPAYTRRAVQDQDTKIFNAQVWCPETPFEWQSTDYDLPAVPLIYEAHVGMAQEWGRTGTYSEFRQHILPRIAEAGYNTVQLMAIMEHPYYGSFGYQVSSFFAASSRFGTPEELKELIDAAHGMGLAVIMDLVHSHAVKNEVEGLSCFDGTLYQYFHEGERGRHPGWDSCCFDYGKPEVLHFLLSNCRFWLDEYRFDGFRFDGVTSMLYSHHGLGGVFNSYDDYFSACVDEDAVAYLSMANKVVHAVRPDAITIAEDVSGMPGLAAPASDYGCGFDMRLAMGVPDTWFKLVNDVRDEDWDINLLWHETTNRRRDEKTVSYAESHDQALVGGKSLIFEMIDAEMYECMRVSDSSPTVDRGIALHKMIRLATLATAGHGYMNFMGNEFGHPEWIDFPREGNNWSYHHARRQWSLRDDPDLKYHYLADFDEAMLSLFKRADALCGTLPRLLKLDDRAKILIFERGGLFLFLNFHPTRSVTDYALEVLPGNYDLILDSDEARFGGHDRLESGQRYATEAVKQGNTLRHLVRVYLPCRTAIVLVSADTLTQ